jgi:hypothetical protein
MKSRHSAASGKGRYRCAGAFDLIELLEVPHPSEGGWDFFYRKHYIETFDYYCADRGIGGIADELSGVNVQSIR